MHDTETTEGAESCKQCTALDWYKLRTGVNRDGGAKCSKVGKAKALVTPIYSFLHMVFFTEGLDYGSHKCIMSYHWVELPLILYWRTN